MTCTGGVLVWGAAAFRRTAQMSKREIEAARMKRWGSGFGIAARQTASTADSLWSSMRAHMDDPTPASRAAVLANIEVLRIDLAAVRKRIDELE